MGSHHGFSALRDLDELQDVVDRGSGAVSVATRQANAQYNLGINGTAAAITPGTVKASSMVVVDANKDVSGFRNVGIAGTLTVTTGGVTLTDVNVALGTTTGTKIGTAVSQKLGFWNATPVVQQANAAQAAVTPSTNFDGADTVDKAVVLAAVQAVETLVNRLRLDLVTTGIIKGAA